MASPHLESLRARITAAGAIPNRGKTLPAYPFVILTQAGRLFLSPREHGVHCVFANPRGARTVLGADSRLNRHSGKWNWSSEEDLTALWRLLEGALRPARVESAEEVAVMTASAQGHSAFSALTWLNPNPYEGTPWACDWSFGWRAAQASFATRIEELGEAETN